MYWDLELGILVTLWFQQVPCAAGTIYCDYGICYLEFNYFYGFSLFLTSNLEHRTSNFYFNF